MIERESCLSPLSAVFIQKTYDMICQCDPHIASWNEHGDMFIVKDPVRLASIYIPRYFDHNNFSSFSRQLNFYGFRKIHSLHEASAHNPNSVHYIRFYHEFFRRGRPDLLCKIKRSTLSNSGSKASNKDVEILKKTVSSLEEKITKMSNEFEVKMREMHELVKSSQSHCKCNSRNSRDAEPQAKRQKVQNIKPKVGDNDVSSSEENIEPADFNNNCDFLCALIDNDVLDETAAEFDPLNSTMGNENGRSFSTTPVPEHPSSMRQIPEGDVVRFLSDIFNNRGVVSYEESERKEVGAKS